VVLGHHHRQGGYPAIGRELVKKFERGNFRVKGMKSRNDLGQIISENREPARRQRRAWHRLWRFGAPRF
jgi:hypothetical protein